METLNFIMSIRRRMNRLKEKLQAAQQSVRMLETEKESLYVKIC